MVNRDANHATVLLTSSLAFLPYCNNAAHADVDGARFFAASAPTLRSSIHSNDAGERFLAQMDTGPGRCHFDAKSSEPQLICDATLKCVSDCNSDDPIASNNIVVRITVVSFKFDSAKNETYMRLLLNSKYNESGCSFGSGEGFEFEDETGKTYLPGGQLKSGRSLSLMAGQDQYLTAAYSFSPSPGAIYTLRPKDIVCDGHSIGYTPTYGDIQFTLRSSSPSLPPSR